MVSSTLCPTVHILSSQNVYGRAEGIADHYWPWAVFLLSKTARHEYSTTSKEIDIPGTPSPASAATMLMNKPEY